MLRTSVNVTLSLTGALNCINKKRNDPVYGQLQRRLKKELSISALQSRAQARGIVVHQQPTVQQLDKEIKILQAKIKVSHKESAERRQEYLLDQTNIANDNNEQARPTELKKIRNSKKRAEAYRHLKYNRTDTSIHRKITRLKTKFMAN